MRKIITISREFGSGGRELGKRIEPKVRVSNQPILFQMAAAGVGIGVASRVAFEAQPNPRVRAIRLTNYWAKRYIRIAVPTEAQRRIRWAKELIDALQSST